MTLALCLLSLVMQAAETSAPCTSQSTQSTSINKRGGDLERREHQKITYCPGGKPSYLLNNVGTQLRDVGVRYVVLSSFCEQTSRVDNSLMPLRRTSCDEEYCCT